MSVQCRPFADSCITHKQGLMQNHVWYSFYYDKEDCPFCKLETNSKIVEAAKEVRLNVASMTPEMQKIIDHNGWMTVLRNRLDNRPDDAE